MGKLEWVVHFYNEFTEAGANSFACDALVE
jgi:hypothetical protein